MKPKINPTRHLSLFNPDHFEDSPIHIVGDNRVARQTAYLLAKLGCAQVIIWGSNAEAMQEIVAYVEHFAPIQITVRQRSDISSDISGVVMVVETSLTERINLYQNCLEMASEVLQVLDVRTYNGDLPKVVTVPAMELFAQSSLYEAKDQVSWDYAIACPLRSRIAATYLVGQFVVWSQIAYKMSGKEDRLLLAEQLIAPMEGLDAPSIGRIELLTPEHASLPLHVIGVGATGSHLVALLAECGFRNISVYDFDAIESHNVANQWFGPQQIDLPKIQALFQNINKFFGFGITPRSERIGKKSSPLTGIVFLLTDKMESRKEIADAFLNRPEVPCIVETRMSAELSQIYIATQKDYATWRSTLFDTEVYKPEVSACGTSITISTTAKLCVVIAVSEFIDYLTGGHVSPSNTTSFYPPHMSAI